MVLEVEHADSTAFEYRFTGWLGLTVSKLEPTMLKVGRFIGIDNLHITAVTVQSTDDQ
jgi:hypothetical protein